MPPISPMPASQNNIFGLRPYQLTAVSKIEQYWSEGIQSVVCQLPTGAGKSRIIRQITDNYAANKKVIYLVAHRNTLVRQLSLEIAEADIKHGIIQAGAPFLRYRIQVCSMQTLVRRLEKLAEPEIIIIDECFPAGTIVDGAGPIESIKAGDSVTSYDEKTGHIVRRKVLAIMSHVHQGDLIQITSCGKVLTCTRNHPLLTKRGWVEAENIGADDELLHAPQFFRVDSTQVLKQGSLEWLVSMHGDDRVYNIEVEETSTYLIDGIVVHNCHHAKATSYLKIFKRWPKAKVLGMTATPSRPDGKGLDDIFDKLILGPTMRELIEAGFLSDYEYYAPAVLDMEGVKKRGGEYNTEQTLERVDKKFITGSAVEHYKKYADHKPAIASCVSIAHSEHVAQEFRDAGYRAIAVNSTMDALTVQRSIDGLRDGSIEILTQCEMLGEGVDVPAATCLIGLRPTASLVIFLQHCGRVLRKSPGKEKAIILDHVGNWSRFGLPDDDRVWMLEGQPKGKAEPSKYKRCPECLHPVAVSARTCPYCGFQWTETADPMERVPLEVEGQLVSIRDAGQEATQDLARAISRRAHNLKQAIVIGKEMGIKHTSVYHVWTKVLHLNVDSII